MSVQHFSGGCQCGAVRFEADLDLDRAVTCNCSRCRRLGSIITFTSPAGFRLDQGSDVLKEFLFNRRVVRHQFCSVCGIEPFSLGQKPDGTQMVAVNVRCLDGVDTAALTPKFFDGASL